MNFNQELLDSSLQTSQFTFHHFWQIFVKNVELKNQLS